jgi:hypothetical protein
VVSENDCGPALVTHRDLLPFEKLASGPGLEQNVRNWGSVARQFIPTQPAVAGWHRGDAMSVGAKCLISRFVSARFALSGAFSLGLFLGIGICQDQPKSNSITLKYDLQTETKISVDVEEVKLFALGTRKDFVELVVKSGQNKLEIYVCPKPFQDEMGITLSKGDTLTITGAKVKREEAEVILARELVRGQDTFLLRDSKGSPIWDSRTGK